MTALLTLFGASLLGLAFFLGRLYERKHRLGPRRIVYKDQPHNRVDITRKTVSQTHRELESERHK